MGLYFFKSVFYSSQGRHTSQLDQPAKRISKPWFDRDCYIAKNLVLEKLNELRKTNARDDYLRLAYVNARARYNSLLKAKKLQYTHIKGEELIQERIT